MSTRRVRTFESRLENSIDLTICMQIERWQKSRHKTRRQSRLIVSSSTDLVYLWLSIWPIGRRQSDTAQNLNSSARTEITKRETETERENKSEWQCGYKTGQPDLTANVSIFMAATVRPPLPSASARACRRV